MQRLAASALVLLWAFFARAETWVCLGDSITHGGAYPGYLQLYWNLRHPGSTRVFLNHGHSGGSGLEAAIAAEHRILVSDEWFGSHRIIFDFHGRKAWVVEPKVPAAGRPWIWTMQWMGAFLPRTGALALGEKGYYHVHLEAFETRADDNGLKALAEFQDYLVTKLGFAPKARLIGMSWGGFYSVRYAAAYPGKVARIYLDAPLLNFEGFGSNQAYTPTEAAKLIGPWADSLPAPGRTWTDDPRMPVNLAEVVARSGIPVLLLYGGQDQTVKPALNAELFAQRFEAAGGQLERECRWGYGHHPHGVELDETARLVKFLGE